MKYNVIGVPKIVINEKIEFMGEFNEDLFAEHVLLGSIKKLIEIKKKFCLVVYFHCHNPQLPLPSSSPSFCDDDRWLSSVLRVYVEFRVFFESFLAAGAQK